MSLVALSSSWRRREDETTPMPVRWSRPNTDLYISRNITAADGGTTISLAANTDYLLRFTEVVNKRIAIVGGRNVVIIGGEININQEWTDTTQAVNTAGFYRYRMGLLFENQTGTIYLEGLKIHGIYCTDAINSSSPTASWVIQNCYFEVTAGTLTDTTESDGYYHSDVIQISGGAGTVKYYNNTLISTGKGQFFGYGTAWGETILDRVNFRQHPNAPLQRAPSGTRSQDPRIFNLISGMAGPVVINALFAKQEEDRTFDTSATGIFYSPGNIGTNVDGKRTFQPTTVVTNGINNGAGGIGLITEGVPAGGDYCPSRQVGLNYKPGPVLAEEFTIQDTDAITYSGSWLLGPATERYTTTAGSYIEFRFTGTHFELFGTTASHHGIADITIDGVAYEADLYSPVRAEGALIFSSPSLAATAHTIRITNSGRRNTASTGINIAFDKATVLSTAGDPYPNVGSVPGAPQSVQVTKDTTAGTATLTWQPPAGSDVSNYIVSRTSGPTVTLASTERLYTFGNLSVGSTYELSVAASNSAGLGPLVTLSITMDQEVVITAPGAPTSVSTSGITNTSITLNWLPPTNDGGSAVTGYSVIRSGGSRITLAATARSYNFTGLTAGTSYTLSTSAINSAGIGTVASRTVSTTGGTVGNVVEQDTFEGPDLRPYISSSTNSSNPTWYVEGTSTDGSFNRIGGVLIKNTRQEYHRMWVKRRHGGPGKRLRVQAEVRTMEIVNANTGNYFEGFKFWIKFPHHSIANKDNPASVTGGNGSSGPGAYLWFVHAHRTGGIYNGNGYMEISRSPWGSNTNYDSWSGPFVPYSLGTWETVECVIEWRPSNQIYLSVARNGVVRHSRLNTDSEYWPYPGFVGMRTDNTRWEMRSFKLIEENL